MKRKDIIRKYMRIFLPLVVLIAVVAVLSACKASTESFTPEPFTANVSVKTDKAEICGLLECKSAEEISFTISKPQSIAGIKIETQSGELKMSFDGAEFTPLQLDKMTRDKNTFEKLFECLGAFEKQSFEINPHEKNSLKGEYEYGTYSVILDGESKSIVCIEAGESVYLLDNFKALA